MIDYIWRVNNLDVYYTNETNGGGDYFAIEYMNLVKDWYGKVNTALEWCSGPGFIGYGLLSSELCDEIAFNEMYQPAIEMLERTKNNSKFANNVSIYKGDTLDCIPNNKKFELVVGNPPHWKDTDSAGNSLGINPSQYKHVLDILVDQDWNAHRSFFKSMKLLLAEDGKILLQENYNGSNPDDFRKMVDYAGLRITSTANSVMYADKRIYYLEVKHK